MSDSRERTDRLLDEIDELVDASLRRGDQSGSWQGERYDRCPKCDEAWHFLPITRTMYQMRLGSYGQDEFGQGIVDPDYKYQEDTSPILCPGSEWLGPPIGNREWGWYLRKSGRRPPPTYRRQSPTRRDAGVERGPRFSRYPVWRFKGPFEHWDVELNHQVQFADRPGPGRLVRPEPIGAITTATFRYTEPIPIPDSVWLLANGDHVLRDFWGTDENGISRHYAIMKPISFQYYDMVAYGDHIGRSMPEYVTFETDFPIESVNWWQDFWDREGTGYTFDIDQARVAVQAVADQIARGPEENYVVMDESHTWSEERLRQMEEDIAPFNEAIRDTIIEMSNASGLTPEEVERLLTDEAHSSGQGGTTEEATDEDERG